MPGHRSQWFGPGEKPERPADKAVRRANLRRIARLFRPYRVRLAAVCALILVSAALGVVSPFLLRHVLDTADVAGSHRTRVPSLDTVVSRRPPA